MNLGVRRVIAKAISEDQGAVLRENRGGGRVPERDMALRLAKKLLTSSVMDYISLDNDVEITEIKITDRLTGRCVQDFPIRQKFGLNIICNRVWRKTDTEIRPDYAFQDGDVIVVIGKSKNVQRFEREYGC